MKTNQVNTAKLKVLTFLILLVFSITLGMISCEKEISEDFITDTDFKQVKNPNNIVLLNNLFNGEYKTINRNNDYNLNLITFKLPILQNGMLKFNSKADFHTFLYVLKEIEDQWIIEDEAKQSNNINVNKALDIIEIRLKHKSFRKVIEFREKNELKSNGVFYKNDINKTYVKDRYLQSVLNFNLEIQIENIIYKYDSVKNDHYQIKLSTEK